MCSIRVHTAFEMSFPLVERNAISESGFGFSIFLAFFFFFRFIRQSFVAVVLCRNGRYLCANQTHNGNCVPFHVVLEFYCGGPTERTLLIQRTLILVTIIILFIAIAAMHSSRSLSLSKPPSLPLSSSLCLLHSSPSYLISFLLHEHNTKFYSRRLRPMPVFACIFMYQRLQRLRATDN